MTTEELTRRAIELGLDAVGVARAEPYLETERHIRERRARGLFGRLRFTTARPEVSCHPERLVADARSVVSAALCYYAPEPELADGCGRLPRYAWHDGYATLRAALGRLGVELGAPYRVLVDSNDHVDREAAARAGVGFYGKNTMLITPRHGSWVVLGTLVSAAELEPTPRLRAGCGACTLCIEACPTGALDEPGVLDATACLSYWTQVPGAIPEPYRASLGAQVYGCDICQEACPWNRGVERRRAGLEPDPDGHVDLLAWLDEGSGPPAALERLYVPRKDARFLRRNALVALGNRGRASARARERARELARGEDELLAEQARWALERLDRPPAGAVEAPCA